MSNYAFSVSQEVGYFYITITSKYKNSLILEIIHTITYIMFLNVNDLKIKVSYYKSMKMLQVMQK